MPENMTVAELKDELRALDLPTSGTKAELLTRLAEAEGVDPAAATLRDLSKEQLAQRQQEKRLALRLVKMYVETLEETLRPLVRFKIEVTRPAFNLSRQEFDPWLKEVQTVITPVQVKKEELELQAHQLEYELKEIHAAHEAAS